MDICRKDIISNLPESLICYILSFVSTKEAALTSVLAKKWRYLFAFSPNLDFKDPSYLHPEASSRTKSEINTDFVDFVDRVLDLRGNSSVNKFSLTCGDCVSPCSVNGWISNALELAVSDLDLRVTVDSDEVIPSKVFVSKSLVKLRIETEFCLMYLEHNVYLPKLKSLHLDSVLVRNSGNCLVKIVSNCHVLEELVMINSIWLHHFNRSVSSNTLKRLTFSTINYDRNPESVSFDTPNLVYLEYSDHVAEKYPKLNLDSLVEAHISFHMTDDQRARASYDDPVGNVTSFLMGIRNVRILYLSAYTLKVLTFCCELIPVFNNLIHLTIKTHGLVGWESLPTLLKKCPNLETLIFEGLDHKCTKKCEEIDGCLCKPVTEIPSCLLSSPVKVVKIFKFGQTYNNDHDISLQIDQVQYFLETMPNLQQMIVYYDTQNDQDVTDLSMQLQMLPSVASPNCKIQVISDCLSLSSSSSTNGLTFFQSAFPV